VEINSTFYRWPRSATFANWRQRLPPWFIAPECWIARIAESLVALGDRCGPLLVQLPPDLAVDVARLAYFLAQVPPGCGLPLSCGHPSWHREDIFSCWSATARPTA